MLFWGPARSTSNLSLAYRAGVLGKQMKFPPRTESAGKYELLCAFAEFKSLVCVPGPAWAPGLLKAKQP
jgi:hypothetical protein